MSDFYLFLALAGTFGFFVLIGFAAESAFAERRRAVRILETQVQPTQSGITSMREQELSRSFNDRFLMPLIRRLGGLARRVTPLDTRQRISHKLELAGVGRQWDAERVVALKLIGGVGGFALGGLLSLVGHFSFLLSGILVGLTTAVGYFAADGILGRQVEARQREIRNSLPDVLDLLTISVEAGLALNAALAEVVENVPGVLAQEVSRMLQEVQLGVSRSEAFRHLAERTDVDELNAFTLAMIQADIFGVSISNVLRAQAKEMRVKRRQRAEREAQQAPVKIVFPLILCILPSLFVVVIGPGAIRIFQNVLSTR